jgi:hypothetical protein
VTSAERVNESCVCVCVCVTMQRGVLNSHEVEVEKSSQEGRASRVARSLARLHAPNADEVVARLFDRLGVPSRSRARVTWVCKHECRREHCEQNMKMQEKSMTR